MDQTYVEELKRQANRFADEKDELARYLDELTTDGAGLLYDLKMVVGAETDLGRTISSLGGAVRRAANNAVRSLDDAYAIINNQCSQLSSMLEEITFAYSQQAQRIDAITFR